MHARAGIARWIVISSLAAIVAVGGGISWWLWRAHRQEQYVEQIESARRFLQISRNEDALEMLSVVDDGDAPAEYHYLKAITLDRLNRSEPANAEIARAIRQEPGNSRYKGLELRFRLMAREKSAMDQLIELNREYASVAAVALFSTYGFQAKALLLQSTGNPKAAQYHHSRKTQTLDTALTLRADIPELHPELMRFARKNKRPQDALELVNGMLKLDAENLELRSQKVRLLVSAGKPDDAATLSLELYEETGKKKEGAEYVASVLAYASHSDENDSMFEQLLKDFGRNPAVVTKHAVYLARHGQLQAAQKQLSDAMERMKSDDDRETLAFVSISLPLEAQVVDLAEEQMRKHEKHLRDPLLKDYFLARMLYLRERHSEAVQLMLKIVQQGGASNDGSQALAQEALAWVKQILSDKVLREQMDKVLKAAGMAGGPAVKVRVASEDELQAAKDDKQPNVTPSPEEQPDRQPPPDEAPAGTISSDEQ